VVLLFAFLVLVFNLIILERMTAIQTGIHSALLRINVLLAKYTGERQMSYVDYLKSGADIFFECLVWFSCTQGSFVFVCLLYFVDNLNLN
jgi:hypothetical protein